MKNAVRLTIIGSMLALPFTVPSAASAAEVLTVTATTPVSGTVDLKYTDGRVETSAPLWTGQVPTGVRVPVPSSNYSSCTELTFSIQATQPLDRMKDVDVDFEVWTASGTKVMSDNIWGYSDWNPSGGPTQVDMTTCDPLPDGSYNLFVTTQDELSTNGLLSSYLEGKQTFSFQVAQAAYVKCKKSYTTKVVAGKKCPKGWKKVKA